MRRSTAAALAGIVLLGLLLRLLPAVRSLYWGADFGEYHRITQGLLAEGQISLDYRGWGTAYPYFPGMHVIQAMGVFAGASPLSAEVLLVPALGSASVLFAFLLAVRLTRDDRVGLVSAAFLAVVMPHVYPTAHAIPGALADPMLAAALLLLWRMRGDRRWLGILVPLTAAIVVTHHFTTYFLIVAAFFAVLVRVAVRARQTEPSWRREAAYLAFLLAVAFSYWVLYATPFQKQIFPQVQFVPWWALLGAFLLAVPLLHALRRLRLGSPRRYVPRHSGRERSARLVLLGCVGVFAFMLAVTLVGIPGTTLFLPPEALALLAPVLVLFAFSAAGHRPADFAKDGIDLSGWFLGFGLSSLAGTLIASTVLVPYRHMQYLMWPVAVFAALGMRAVFDLPRMTARRRAWAVSLVAALIVAAIPATFPPRAVLAGHEEGLPPQALNAPLWISGGTWGLLASDHMGSMAAFGFGGRDAVWDLAPETLRSDSFADARAAFAVAPYPVGVAPVRFVLLNDDIEAGAMLLPWEPRRPSPPRSRGSSGPCRSRRSSTTDIRRSTTCTGPSLSRHPVTGEADVARGVEVGHALVVAAEPLGLEDVIADRVQHADLVGLRQPAADPQGEELGVPLDLREEMEDLLIESAGLRVVVAHRRLREAKELRDLDLFERVVLQENLRDPGAEGRQELRDDDLLGLEHGVSRRVQRRSVRIKAFRSRVGEGGTRVAGGRHADSRGGRRGRHDGVGSGRTSPSAAGARSGR